MGIFYLILEVSNFLDMRYGSRDEREPSSAERRVQWLTHGSRRKPLSGRQKNSLLGWKKAIVNGINYWRLIKEKTINSKSNQRELWKGFLGATRLVREERKISIYTKNFELRVTWDRSRFNLAAKQEETPGKRALHQIRRLPDPLTSLLLQQAEDKNYCNALRIISGSK